MKTKPLNILIAPDKFKGSLGAVEVARALSKGILKKYPHYKVTQQPMADGGDGSIDLLAQLGELTSHQVKVHDPLFRLIDTVYYTQQGVAFIEMAKASGIALLTKQEHNCLQTTTLGTGEMIRDAIRKGFNKIRLFIGGSATNDAALGIAQALGYQFLDEQGQVLSPIGVNLEKVRSFHKSDLEIDLQSVDFQVVCDVVNPFFGENGAAYVYAPQKGANSQEVALLDQGLRNVHQIFLKEGLPDVQAISGAGAAGGVGGGMVAFFGASLTAGIQLFIDLFDLEAKVKQADVVITGEGQLDDQSLQGKVVGGIGKLCSKYQKPLVVVCGQNKLPDEVAQTSQISQIKSMMDYANSVENAMKKTAEFLEKIGEELSLENEVDT